MRKPKIGLALGAGGARGFAHIGVLQVLEESGIPVDCIAGSSMGSLIGAFYCTGMETRYMEKLAVHLKRRHWIDFTVPKMGFVSGVRIMEMVRFLTKEMNFEDTEIPLAVVATDVEKGERVVFRHGPIYRAVRASIAIPGVFVPAHIENRVLVDGGVIDRVPVSVCREMGADIVIAVDVGLTERAVTVKSIFDVFFQTIEIMEREIVKTRILDADIVICPDVGHISSTAFTNVEETIALGRKAAEEMADQIRRLVEDWKGDA
jgi:NTE family protein